MKMKFLVNKLGIITGPFLLLCLAVGLAWASDDDLYTFIRLFDKIAVTVSDRYVTSLDPEKLIKAGINGMLNKLDPYSRYLSDRDYFRLMRETQGEYFGVGVEIKKHSDTLWVSSIIEGSPAYSSSIRIGDRIIKIDTVDVIGMSESECWDLLKGEKDSRIVLKIWRPQLMKALNLEFIRKKIYINSVSGWCIDKYNNGYIKIAKFSEGSAQEIKHIILLLLDKEVNGLIIDMQNNPGGLINEAVETAALFLKKGDNVVETKGRNGLRIRTYKAREDGIYCNGPLVVVTNDQTASAAEIVAGAIQDHDRGLIVGAASFGKGLVQQVMEFADNTALKLTTSKYYTPSSRCIQKDSALSNLIKGESKQNILHYTNSGRPVFSGGGIIPDIYVDQLEKPPFLKEIISLGFATDFVSEYGPKLNIDESFAVDDSLVDLFLDYIEKRDYVYRSPAYNSFEQFLTENAKLIDEIKLENHTEAIKNILNDRSQTEILSLRSQVKNHLYESFITISLGERKAYELVWLKTHPELVKAGEVLNDPKIYSSLLANY